MQLTEKYRPRRLAQVLGQDAVVKKIRRIISRRGWDRDVFWLSGPTGCGKTSLARAMANEVGCGSWSIEEIDGDACSVDRVRQIGANIGLAGWGCGNARAEKRYGAGWRTYIINESHAMTPRAVQAWLTLMEHMPARRLVIFTTTDESRTLFDKFTSPFLDRTKNLHLTKIGLREIFARLACRIATREALNGRDLGAYLQLLADSHNSMRAALQAVECGDMLEAEYSPAIQKMITAGRKARTRKATMEAKARPTRGRKGKSK